LHALVTDGSMAILLVEQRIDVALDLAARYVVMDRGRVVHSGSTADLRIRQEQLPQMMRLDVYGSGN
jgi:branched-chain amino acid transport system ATP-binding protein